VANFVLPTNFQYSHLLQHLISNESSLLESVTFIVYVSAAYSREEKHMTLAYQSLF